MRLGWKVLKLELMFKAMRSFPLLYTRRLCRCLVHRHGSWRFRAQASSHPPSWRPYWRTSTRLAIKRLKFISFSYRAKKDNIVGITKQNHTKHVFFPRSLIRWRWGRIRNGKLLMSSGVRTRLGLKELAIFSFVSTHQCRVQVICCRHCSRRKNSWLVHFRLVAMFSR